MSTRVPAAQRPRGLFSRTLTLVLTITAVVLFVCIARPYVASPVSFDGAMNLQVSQALAESAGYARFYGEWTLFPEEVQTNAPFVIPASIVFSAFGVSFVSSQVVSLVYCALFLLAVFWLIRSVSGSNWALLAVLLAMTVTDFGRFALNGYGEVPALFWCLLALTLGSRGVEIERADLMLWAGACLGLSVLTKIVMLMPVGVSVLLLSGASLNLGFRRGAVRLVQGVAAVLLLFECWRLWSFGHLGAWESWWGEQLTAIMAQAGVSDGFSDTSGIMAKLAVHSAAFSDAIHVGFPWVLGLLLLPLVGSLFAFHALAMGEGDRRRVLILCTLLAIGLAYFCWWLLVTPTQKAWYRRIFNGWLVCAVLLPLLLSYALGLRATVYRWLSAALLAIPLGLMVWSSVQSVSFRKNEVRSSGVASAAVFLRSLPDNARFYGYGWYSAPVMSLYADVRVHDLAQSREMLGVQGIDHYLLADANLRASGNLEPALAGSQAELVHDGGPWAKVYKLTPE